MSVALTFAFYASHTLVHLIVFVGAVIEINGNQDRDPFHYRYHFKIKIFISYATLKKI